MMTRIIHSVKVDAVKQTIKNHPKHKSEGVVILSFSIQNRQQKSHPISQMAFLLSLTGWLRWRGNPHAAVILLGDRYFVNLAIEKWLCTKTHNCTINQGLAQKVFYRGYT